MSRELSREDTAALMSSTRSKPEKPEKPKISQRLSRDLTCSICLDLFKQPVSLPCDHTFCKACITGYWSGARSPTPPGSVLSLNVSVNVSVGVGAGVGVGNSNGSCPQCRKTFPGQSYRPNRIVANIVESYTREIGEESAPPAGPTSAASTAEARATHAPSCTRHREELKLYCEEEHELVCLICAVSQEHRAHALICVDEAEQKYRNSLNSSVSALQTELNTALQCERKTENEVKKLKEHTADLKQRIEAQFSDLHQVLYQEEKLLQVKLKTEERRELIRLDEHKALLSVEISRLRRALNEIEENLKENDPYILLRNIKTLLQRQPLKFEKPTLTPPKLCEGRFAGPLQYRVWKSLKGSIYPVPSAITFNSSTANPWLSVTPSLTCVRYQTFNSSARDTPQRFDAALSILGSQGFTHGCHYWEIEVSSSTVWTVGVARESIGRKGVIKALPSNGIWTVSLSYGVQYMAGTWPPTVLSLHEQLERVGVYLDYKRGLVSFYNAESMTHLYTFRDTFNETLYPYFNLGFLDKVHENEPLKVFVPKI